MSSMASISFKHKKFKGPKQRGGGKLKKKKGKKRKKTKAKEKEKKIINCWYCHKSLEISWHAETKWP